MLPGAETTARAEMKQNQRIEITQESRRLLRVRLPEETITSWCPACAAEVRWVGVREASALSGASEQGNSPPPGSGLAALFRTVFRRRAGLPSVLDEA